MTTSRGFCLSNLLGRLLGAQQTDATGEKRAAFTSLPGPAKQRSDGLPKSGNVVGVRLDLGTVA